MGCRRGWVTVNGWARSIAGIHCGGTFMSLLPSEDDQSFLFRTQGKANLSCVALPLSSTSAQMMWSRVARRLEIMSAKLSDNSGGGGSRATSRITNHPDGSASPRTP
jgi:hypothetical protein